MKKIGIILISALILASMLVSCGSTEYRNDVTALEVTDTVKHLVPVNKGYTEADSDFVDFNFTESGAGKIKSNVKDISIVYSSEGSDINEFGVFLVEDGKNVNEVKKAVEEYANKKVADLRDIVEMYSEDEVKKLDNVKVSTFGNYVVYTILDSASTTAVTNEVKDLLKK